MNQQRGFAFAGVDGVEALQLAQQIVEQRVGVARVAHHIADFLLHHRRTRKRTQVEANHGALDPAPRGVDIRPVARAAVSAVMKGLMASVMACDGNR